MSNRKVHDFGIIDDMGDVFEFHVSDPCSLEEIVQTERGPRRIELASIPVSAWNAVSNRAIRELVTGMGESERSKKIAPNLENGTNRLSPLIGRELAVLLWALMEADPNGNIEAILHGWRELAREERWWLYAKGAAPGQKIGYGWRRALFHALSETSETRVADTVTPKKKSPGIGSLRSRKKTEKPQKQKSQLPTIRKKKESPKPMTVNLKKRVARKTLTNN